MGFGMALAQNEAAMKKFEMLPQAEKEQILEKTHQVHSKREMQALVSSLANSGAVG
jgi:hypothetical protein